MIAGGREAVAMQAANIAATYAQLSPEQKAIVTIQISCILAEREQ